MTQTEPTWYDRWFNSRWYSALYHHRTELEAREAIELVTHLAGVPEGARILDLCCGYGRHAVALAELGYHVTGLDASTYLIEKAEMQFPHERVSYVIGDMRGPFPGAPFDAIVNFFTSFGYFEDHRENALVLQSVHDALTPSGLFILDFLNALHVRRTLQPETISMIGSATIIQERWIDGDFVRKKITVNDPCSSEMTFEECVRLYSCEELIDMIEVSGLKVRSIAGSYDGEEFNPSASERCIIISRKQ